MGCVLDRRDELKYQPKVANSRARRETRFLVETIWKLLLRVGTTRDNIESALSIALRASIGSLALLPLALTRLCKPDSRGDSDCAFDCLIDPVLCEIGRWLVGVNLSHVGHLYSLDKVPRQS